MNIFFTIAVHVNYKFPIEPAKQELRWMVLKPRIDSKCRAQRRLQRDQLARLNRSHVRSGRQSKNHRTPIIDEKVRVELLYGCGKPETSQQSTIRDNKQLGDEQFQDTVEENKMNHIASFDQSQLTVAVLPDYRGDSASDGEQKIS